MNMRLLRKVGVVSFAVALVVGGCRWVKADPVKLAQGEGAVPVKLTKVGTRWQLQRSGAVYAIKGAGGSGSRDLLARLGGNSIRTWGVGDETQHDLD
jgi:hypothetical protein